MKDKKKEKTDLETDLKLIRIQYGLYKVAAGFAIIGIAALVIRVFINLMF